MKKLVALLLAAVMSFALVACGGGETPNADDNSTQEQQTQKDNIEPESTDPEVTEPDVSEPGITDSDVSEPESTAPEETTDPAESLAELRKAELLEILCGGKWVEAFEFDYPNHLPSEINFFDDGTMKYVTGSGEEYSGNPWSFVQYVINGEIEGRPGFAPAIYQTRIEYSDEQGVYYFNCEGLSMVLVGYSEDGEYIIHKDGYPYKKVVENN